MNAGDIARLVDVGRAAVSNWRRRHDDFPQPVGGTASSPLFSLPEVEEWLRRNGKAYQVSLADRVWQRLRAAGDDLRLGDRVAAAGALLTNQPTTLDTGLRRLIGELATERGAAGAFEFLCDRYLEAHSRQLSGTAPDVVQLIREIVGGDAWTVLDPACGLGSLLLAIPAKRVLGQELTVSGAAIARARLLLAESGRATTAVAGDSLRHDPFAGELADVVVCDPPFNERAWGYAELTGDPRWVHGLPPRGESELAWVQHCLAHTRPGGLAAVLMPPAAASRRPGKRIRGNLLRAGALRAVIALGTADLWLLRQPRPGERPPSHLLLVPVDDRDDAVAACRWHLAEPDHPSHLSVRIIDLLDDDVDISPSRRRPQDDGTDIVAGYQDALRELRAAVPNPPELVPLPERRDLPTTTIGELAKAGVLSVAHGPAKLPPPDRDFPPPYSDIPPPDGDVLLPDGEVPVLTADDLADGRPPSGRTVDTPELVHVAPGDVVASVLGAARVMTTGGAVLGPYLTRYRVDPDRLDPDFLAGLLRAGDTHPGSSRVDVRRHKVPLLTLVEQRAYGAAFRELADVADVLRAAADAGERLVRLGFDGLIAGHLRPENQPGDRC